LADGGRTVVASAAAEDGGEMKRGLPADGFDDEDQGWPLKHLKLLIGRLFHVGYTIQTSRYVF
jgi:hypothetical protein